MPHTYSSHQNSKFEFLNTEQTQSPRCQRQDCLIPTCHCEPFARVILSPSPHVILSPSPPVILSPSPHVILSLSKNLTQGKLRAAISLTFPTTPKIATGLTPLAMTEEQGIAT